MRSIRGSAGDGLLLTLFEAGPVGGLSDGQLLNRFIELDGLAAEQAVAALIDRHAAMVWRICRTSLANQADASDAFQATFLTLLRRAQSIRSRESVAGWLGGVARRVAANAGVTSARRRAREQARAGRIESEADPVASDVWTSELAMIVRDELARLSDRDREVLLACDLDGLTETEAARRLDCPLGTIRSRLHRARNRLRHRFTARGLDPTAAFGILPTIAISKVSPTLIARTVALAVQSGAGVGGWFPVAPVAVVALLQRSGRSLLMPSLASTVTVLVGLLAIVIVPAPEPRVIPEASSSQDPGPKIPPVAVRPPAADEPEAGELKSKEMAEQFAKLKFDYDLARLNATKAGKSGKTEFEQYQIRNPLQPDETAYARKMITLALLDPPSKVARDAAIWIMDKTWLSEAGAYGGEYETAVSILVTHHADDPEAVRVGLQLDNIVNRRRDAFLEGCYANATSHESKGLARLAYAQYLEKKIPPVRGAHHFPQRSEIHFETYDKTGNLVPTTILESNEEFAYEVGLRWIDPIAMQTEVERLYHEVITDYADVRYINRGLRRIEAELAHPIRPDGSSMSVVERAMAEQMVKSKTTLAEVARGRLLKLTTLVTGKPAPAVAGVDLKTSQPFQLSDYQGQPVLLLFWGDIVDRDFVRQVKAKVGQAREKGQPFTVLGVVYASDPAAARRLVDQEQVPWLNTAEGTLTSWGPIAEKYQIHNVPRAILIGPDGKIARPEVPRSLLDVAIDELREGKEATKPPG